MALTYETLANILIPNTTMQKILLDGVHKQYDILPNEGYVLHDNTLDFDEIDEETHEPTGNVVLGYYPIGRTCSVNYDFDNTTIIDGYTAYGSREFFARPANEVPTEQIFSSNKPEH